jgi:hypothetical protein
MTRKHPTGLSVCLAALALAAAGCGPSWATVSGKVTVHGKPVTVGTVLFVGADSQIATGKLDGEGHYTAPRVPLGSLKVAVQTLRPEQVRGKAANVVLVPQQYADPDTSGLTCDVQRRQQKYDIELP